MWSRDPWDSELLQVDVVRLSSAFIRQPEVAEKELSLFCGGYAFAKIPAGDPALLQRFQRLGYAVISTELDLELLLASWDGMLFEEGGSARYEIAGAAQELVLRDLASKSFAFDRYHLDPTISQEVADRSRSLWVASALERRDVLVWVVVLDRGQVAGFAVSGCTGRQGSIQLICIDGPHRNKGYGRALCGKAALWWKEHTGASRVLTTTQAANIPALRMYLAVGFQPICSRLVVRKWIRDD